MASGERNAQPFSTQSGGQQRKTIGKFVEAFEASGNDLAGLLVAFGEHSATGSKVVGETKAGVREVLQEMSAESEKTLDRVLDVIRELHGAKTTKDRERLRIMSVLAPIFPRADLIRRGFRVSNDAFAKARKHSSIAGPGAPVQVGGRPRVYTPQLAIQLDHFCCRPDISYANPNYIVAYQSLTPEDNMVLAHEEMVQVEDQYGHPVEIPLRATILSNDHAGKEIPNRILRVSIHTLHQRFMAENPETPLSVQGIRSLLPKNIVRRSRDQDLQDATEDPHQHELQQQQQQQQGALNDPNLNGGAQKRKRGRPTRNNNNNNNNTLINPPPLMHSELDSELQDSATLNPLPDDPIEPAHLTHELVHTLQPVGTGSNAAPIHPEDEDLVSPEDSAPARKRPKLSEDKK